MSFFGIHYSVTSSPAVEHEAPVAPAKDEVTPRNETLQQAASEARIAHAQSIGVGAVAKQVVAELQALIAARQSEAEIPILNGRLVPDAALKQYQHARQMHSPEPK